MSRAYPEQTTNIAKLIWSIVINSVIVVFEVIFGLLIGSLALISDALHNITDIASMVLSLIGERISQWPANRQKTFGYKKIEAIVAFVNSSVLLAVIIFILVEAIKRLFVPSDINGITMLVVAGAAFIGNSIATLILRSKEKNLNMKSAWLHSLQDALFSLAVIIGAVFIYYFHWNIIDPLISILVSLFLIKKAYSIVKESINMLFDSVPDNVNFDEIKNSLLKIEGINEISDLHIWQENSRDTLLSVHIIISDDGSKFKILQEVKDKLYSAFSITHTTLQVVTINEAQSFNDCKHCN